MRTLAATVTAVTLLSLAGPASAATVGSDVFGNVQYQGDAGVNDVTISEVVIGSVVRVTISETGIAELNDTADLCQDNGDNVTCDTGVEDLTRVDVALAGGNDELVALTALNFFMAYDGGPGEDRITGSDALTDARGEAASELIEGGDGRDTLIGGAGNDSLEGGPGDGDDIDAGPGADSIDVDPGFGLDTVRAGDGFDSLDLDGVPDGTPGFVADLAAGRVSIGADVTTLDSIEDVFASDGDDRLTGTAGANELEGEGGDDLIDGGLGTDLLDGGEGNDTLLARDGIGDRALGRQGTDICQLDQLDLHEGCETAEVLQVPVFGTTPADQSGPACTTPGHRRKQRRARSLRRGIPLRLSCDESGRVRARLVGRLKRVGPGSRISARGDVTVAEAGKRLSAAGRASLRLRPARRLRPSIRRGARLRLVVEVTDALGNVRTLTRRITLR